MLKQPQPSQKPVCNHEQVPPAQRLEGGLRTAAQAPSPPAGRGGGPRKRASGVGVPCLELCSPLLDPPRPDPREGDPGRPGCRCPHPLRHGQCPPPGPRAHPEGPAAAPRTTAPGLCISSTWREAWRTLTKTGPRPLTPKR